MASSLLGLLIYCICIPTYLHGGLNAEAERHAKRGVGVVVVRVAAVVVHIAEVRAVGGIRRTQPPGLRTTLTVIRFLNSASIACK